MIDYNDQNIYSYYLEQYEYIFEIIENTQCVFKLEITIINNGKNQWPENVKKLYLNKKSHLRIKGGNINLMPLKRNEKQKVNIIIERLNEINESEYIIY